MYIWSCPLTRHCLIGWGGGGRGGKGKVRYLQNGSNLTLVYMYIGDSKMKG